MKKLIAALLALCLLFSAALAEELLWEDYKEEVAGEGKTEKVKIPDVITFKFWLPKTMKSTDAKKVKADVVPAAAYKAKKGDSTLTITVLEVNSLEEYVSGLETAGAEFFTNLKINGVDCVSCENAERNEEILIMPVEDKKVLVFTFAPLDSDDEDWDEAKDYIIASIRAV